ncbi:hypothetical protein MF271_22965 (plasmid) [Deinococcus sp. KNUC1210]|uniref:hypothetical protein n=1 Tax=Deinococcus sp. KNUC1210 TaxID=2917691 RepID=UPI001EEFA227|nr:hypothetical protein [Deinococcus sp. KNUC1210]ULH18323.1 hypothetical protein MF271_22965 [Deinococcus sp. KNUC1210]
MRTQLVVDGDISDATTINTHPLIKRAIALHKPILFVDVTENHKRNGRGKLIGFNTKGASDGYMVVPVVQPSGKTFYRIYTTAHPLPTPTGGLTATGPSAIDSAFATAVASNIADAHKASLKALNANTSIQPVQQQWSVIGTFPMSPPATGMGVTTPQTGAAAVTVTSTLF